MIHELQLAAEPLLENCTPQVAKQINSLVDEAVESCEDTSKELDALCSKYQNAAKIWERYQEASSTMKAWVDTQMETIANLPPEEAIKQVKVSEIFLEFYISILNSYKELLFH